MTRDMLIRGVGRQDGSGGSGPVRATRRLRRKLGDDAGDPTCIFNKRRFRYRMEKRDT